MEMEPIFYIELVDAFEGIRQSRLQTNSSGVQYCIITFEENSQIMNCGFGEKWPLIEAIAKTEYPIGNQAEVA